MRGWGWALAVALWGLGAAAGARAQTIGGVVVEDSTKVRVAGATVSVLRVGSGEAKAAQTDSTGSFLLPLGEKGKFVVRVSHPSYRSTESDTLTVGEDDALTLELRLARDAIPLEPLVVTARVDRRIKEFHERMARNGFGHFLSRADVERHPGQSVSELLRMVPGVQVQPMAVCRGCATENVLLMRGGADRCLARVLIDGMEVKQDAAMPLDALIMADALEGVEVYPIEATIPPALAQGSGGCGLVALWTKTSEGGKLTWKRLLVALGIAGVLFVLLH